MSITTPSAPASAPAEVPRRSGRHRARRDRPSGAAVPLGHRDDIQGLRAVAVLLVVLGHAGVPFLRGGFIGVDVFFVISGFLITGLLLAGARKQGRVSLSEFYARRAKRILPAAALTLIVTDLVATQLMNIVRAKQAVIDSIWAAFFAANVQFAHQGVDYFAQGQPPSPIQHYWSLAVEEQFYLVWPLLLSLVLFGVALTFRRRSRSAPADDATEAPAGEPRIRRLVAAILVVGAASLTWSIIHTRGTPQAAYFSTLARAWELALGAWLAIRASAFLHLSDRIRAAMGWVGALAIGAAAVLYSESTAFPGSAALLPTVGTALVIAAGIGNERPRWGVGGLLGVGPMRYVGDRSYAFYLWHWPALIIAAAYVGHALSIAANLALLTIAFLASMASYGLVENPIRRAKLHRPVRTGGLLWGTSLALVVLVAGFTLQSIAVDSPPSRATSIEAVPTLVAPSAPVGSSEGSPGPEGSTAPASGPLPAVVAAVEAARDGAPIPEGLTPPLAHLLDDRFDPPSGDCYAQRGDEENQQICSVFTAAGKTIVVFGDSHARQWLPSVVWTALQDGWAIVPLVELGCGPSRYDDQCQSYVEWAVGQVEELHPEVVLIGGEFMFFPDGARQGSVDGIGALVEAVMPFTDRVVVIGDPPSQAQQPVDCLLARNATLASCTRALSDEQLSVYRDVARTTRRRGAAFLDTIGWFCYQRQCPMVIGNTVVYRDSTHITQTYALELRELFRAAFAGAVAGPS
jgi:peptidoglycan/LPS O-acetylase OafA/YrhL